MKDTLNIKQKTGSANHYVIERVMEETINRANLEERKRNLEVQIEGIKDQLGTLEANLKVVTSALDTGKGRTSKEIKDSKAVGGK
jgi:SMC interacting uncharacterized protein involved in chromosome segregation